MSKSLSCGSEEGRSVDGVSRSPRTVGAADGIISPRVGIRLRDLLGGSATSGDAGFGRRASGARWVGAVSHPVTYLPALLRLLRLIAGARGGRRTARRRGVLLTGVRDSSAGAGHHGRRLRELSGLRSGRGARNAFPCDEASTPPALSVPAWASISLCSVFYGDLRGAGI